MLPMQSEGIFKKVSKPRPLPLAEVALCMPMKRIKEEEGRQPGTNGAKLGTELNALATEIRTGPQI